jgi:hypothetical protein
MTARGTHPQKTRDNVSLRTRQRIFRRDRFTCQLCGARPPDVRIEIDHKTPVSLGGTTDDLNLWTLCFSCNRGKANLYDDGDADLDLDSLEELHCAELSLLSLSRPDCCESFMEMRPLGDDDWYFQCRVCSYSATAPI